MIKFLYLKYFLLLIPIIIFLVLLYFYWWKRTLFTWIDDLKKVFKNNTNYVKVYYLLIFIIFIFFTIIFSKPVLENKYDKIIKNWIDMQIVIDVSYSMMAEDIKPNRLDVAKEVITNFVDKISTDRVWVIIYAWKTFRSLPLSFDYEIIKKTLNKINIYTINQYFSFLQWTASWDALLIAANSFSNDNREKVIILLTDWETNKWIDPLAATKYIYEQFDWKIRIYTIWIWWPEKTTVTVTNFDWNKESIEISWVNEEILTLIADITDWKYFNATNKDTLEEVFNTISSLEKKEIIYDTIRINVDKYDIFIYLLILFFYTFLFLKYRKRI